MSWRQAGMGGNALRWRRALHARRDTQAGAREKLRRGESQWQIQVWIPHLLPCARTDCRRSRLWSVDPSLTRLGAGKERWNEAPQQSWSDSRLGGEWFQGQHQGWRKGNNLTAWASVEGKKWDKHCGNWMSTGCKDKCYLRSLSLALVVPLDGFRTKTWAKIRKNCLNVLPQKISCFSTTTHLLVCVSALL